MKFINEIYKIVKGSTYISTAFFDKLNILN